MQPLKLGHEVQTRDTTRRVAFVIIICVGVMKSADAVILYVESYVQKHSWTPWSKVQIRAADSATTLNYFGAVPLLSEKCDDVPEFLTLNRRRRSDTLMERFIIMFVLR